MNFWDLLYMIGKYIGKGMEGNGTIESIHFFFVREGWLLKIQDLTGEKVSWDGSG